MGVAGVDVIVGSSVSLDWQPISGICVHVTKRVWGKAWDDYVRRR